MPLTARAARILGIAGTGLGAAAPVIVCNLGVPGHGAGFALPNVWASPASGDQLKRLC